MFPTNVTKTLQAVSEEFYREGNLHIVSAQCNVNKKKKRHFNISSLLLIILTEQRPASNRDRAMLVGFRAAAGLREEARVTRRMLIVAKPLSDLLVRQDIKASLLPSALRQRAASCGRNVDSQKCDGDVFLGL